MKKISLVLVLAVVMLLSMASMAFAIQGDSGYLAPSAGVNPHMGYGTATQKCAVCHAVHNATAGGEALLMTTRANACTYCHILNNVSTMKAYPTELSYTAQTVFGHNSEGGAACTDCHQVHGATGQMTGNPSLNALILKDISTAAYNVNIPLGVGGKIISLDTGAYYVAPAVGDVGDTAISKWCSQCHAYYNSKTLATFKTDGTTNGTTHVMTDQLIGHAGSSLTVSTECISCHNAGFAGNGSNGLPLALAGFPHISDGARFLKTGAATFAAIGNEDGVCTRCHTNVGTTF